MPDYFADTEHALIQRIAMDDADAFSQVYRHYEKIVFNTVMVYVKNEAETEEIVQQVFVKLWERRAALTGVRSFRDYFFVVVRNHVLNYFNRLSKQARLADIIRLQAGKEPGNEADHRLRQQQYDQLVEKAVRQLPDRQKQVYLMADQEALGYDDIAERMQISRLTAKKHMELARKSVREYISRYLQDPHPSLLGALLLAALRIFH